MFADDGGVHDIVARQLWSFPTETYTSSPAHCTPFTLPSNGVIQLGDQSAITLTTNVVFQPQCTGTDTATGEVISVNDYKDPFYASTIPMVYVIAAATVIAWVLVVMLTITPRTNFFGIQTQSPTFSNSHGIIGGANGGLSGLSGSGSRPWLQKVAALAVAIALTIATADTLQVAEQQYRAGYMDAGGMRKEVLGSLEIRITRVVSDIFLWLAQVQTLIRLFPRHKEKVLIKWIGFVLIILDTIFSCLNSFLINYQQHGRKFVDAIPALSYLFELALGLLYAAWVIYYSLTKRRYAYYSPRMRSISLIALLSLVSILTPVVFFVTDVVNQDVAGWGDYFRWVGAAAASVVVWEWVERIEAVERDDKKDGILGREIFDGDEMLDVMPSEDAPWSQSRNISRNFRRHGGDDDPGGGNEANMVEHGLSGMANRFRSRHLQSPQHYPLGRAHSRSEALSSSGQGDSGDPKIGTVTFCQQARPSQQRESRFLGGPTPPAPVVSPVSRADTTSAASTVYVVRYHPMADVPQPIRRRGQATRNAQKQNGRGQEAAEEVDEKDWVDVEDGPQFLRNVGRWHNVPNPFKRKRASPPQEVQRARAAATGSQTPITPGQLSLRRDVRSRFDGLALGASSLLRDRGSDRRQALDRSVTVVPAQPRGSGRAWSPNERAGLITGPESKVQDQEPESRITTSTTLASVSNTLAWSAPATEFRPGSNVRQEVTQTPPAWPGPPRADDISPSIGRHNGANKTVVVPAPPRRTPPHGNTQSPPFTRTSTAGSMVPGSAAVHEPSPPLGTE